MATTAPAPEEFILREAVKFILQPSCVPAGLAESLDWIDPEVASFTTWRALIALDQFLPTESVWGIRVRSLQRRSYYAYTIALDAAVRVSEQLTRVEINHALWGDLALAMRHPNPGDRPVHAVSISIAEDADLETLRDALSAVPKVVIDHVDSHRLLGRVESIDLRIEKGWLPCPWYRRVPLTDQLIERPESNPSTDQPIPLLADAAEIIRLLELGGSGATDRTWPLDIARLDASDASRLATELGRTAFLIDQWESATDFGLLQTVPAPKFRGTPGEWLKRATTSRHRSIRRSARVAVGLLGEHPRRR